MMGGGAFNSA